LARKSKYHRVVQFNSGTHKPKQVTVFEKELHCKKLGISNDEHLRRKNAFVRNISTPFYNGHLAPLAYDQNYSEFKEAAGLPPGEQRMSLKFWSMEYGPVKNCLDRLKHFGYITDKEYSQF